MTQWLQDYHAMSTKRQLDKPITSRYIVDEYIVMVINGIERENVIVSSWKQKKKSRDKCVKSVVLQLMSIWYGLVLLLIRSHVCVKEVGIMCSVKSLSTSRSSWKTLQFGRNQKDAQKGVKEFDWKKMCSRNQSRSSCCWRGYPSVGGGKKGHSFVLLLLFLFVVETVQGHLLSVLKILLMLSCWEKGLSVIITAGSSYEGFSYEGFSYEDNNRILSYNSQVF